MKTISFKVTLLSDVIINYSAATVGNQKTLDFIPGNAFLGVVAGELYKVSSPEDSFSLFHSGKVRFGDAHPLIEGKKRAIRVPASWYRKKDGKDDNELFVHHGMPKDGLKDEHGNPIQVKQCREDFIINQGGNKVSKVVINKNFAIKSAYDSDKGRSEDAKMYGYQSLQAGSEWCFSIDLDDDVASWKEQLIKALTGRKRVGRSSTAQYGLVDIQQWTGFETCFTIWENPTTRDLQDKVVFVYAESRLIFIDKYGQLTFIPSEKQLGFPGGKICWNMSQVRTFQYAPYNNHRKTRDADRMGIEKGSVFCITGVISAETDKWIGSYQNEGFGKVLINPEFLEYLGENGEARYSYTKEKEMSEIKEFENILIQTNDEPALKYLNRQKQLKEDQKFIYEKVNFFVKEYANRFKDESFASQWGTIRSLAMQFYDPQMLKDKLYTNEDSYLTHGVAAKKWNERGRIKLLENFVDDFKNKQEILSEAIINLAAEMAKKCRKEEKR
jgi:hypothetical protein